MNGPRGRLAALPEVEEDAEEVERGDIFRINAFRGSTSHGLGKAGRKTSVLTKRGALLAIIGRGQWETCARMLASWRLSRVMSRYLSKANERNNTMN